MNSDRWSLVRRLHAEALDFPAAERRAFLERECGGDQILLEEVWELVAGDKDDEFLEAPVVEQVGPGVILGDFELLEEIGSGGTGIVFRARQKSLEREVALKIMPRHFALNERRVARFVREAKAAAKLKHPGIAPIYEVGCVNDNHFFAMELVVGHDLARELELQLEGCGLCSATDSTAQYREAARIVMQTADALAFAHEKGVVHRDVKPNNILLDSECRPRLVDAADGRCVSRHSGDDLLLDETAQRTRTRCAGAAARAGQPVSGVRPLRRPAAEITLSEHGQGEDCPSAVPSGTASGPFDGRSDSERDAKTISC